MSDESAPATSVSTPDVSSFDAAVAALQADDTPSDAAESPEPAESTPADTESTEATPEPAPKHERSKVFRALDKKKAALAAERQAIEAQRAELTRLSEQLTGATSEAAQLRKIKQLAQENPLDVLNELGLSFETLAKKVLESDTPDERVNKALKQLEAERQRLAEVETRLRERATIDVQQRVEADFLAHASDKSLYPELAVYSPEQIIQAGHAIANQLASRGVQLEPGPRMFALVARELNSTLATHHENIVKAKTQTSTATQKTVGASGAPPAKKPLPRPPTKTESKSREEQLRDEAIAALSGS